MFANRINLYREPISKEIIDVKYIPNNFHSNRIFKDLRSLKNPIQFFTNIDLRISRAYKGSQIYRISKSGKNERKK